MLLIPINEGSSLLEVLVSKVRALLPGNKRKGPSKLLTLAPQGHGISPRNYSLVTHSISWLDGMHFIGYFLPSFSSPLSYQGSLYLSNKLITFSPHGLLRHRPREHEKYCNNSYSCSGVILFDKPFKTKN